VSDDEFIESLREFHKKAKGEPVFSHLFRQAHSRASADDTDIVEAIKAELKLRQL
jgi:hypothetical protein